MSPTPFSASAGVEDTMMRYAETVWFVASEAVGLKVAHQDSLGLSEVMPMG